MCVTKTLAVKSRKETRSNSTKMPVTAVSRTKPNILITGTPGTGKSSLCKQLAEKTGYEWLEVSKLAKDWECISDYDEEYDTSVLDEDKLLDTMEPIMANGGKIVDYHGCDFFPERWFNIVFVLRTDNTILYDRLSERGYTGKKLSDNVECEIFQTLLEEAKSSYDEDIVHELQSSTLAEAASNLERIVSWTDQWTKDNTS
ncbi:adenylate kinase isoenzyme 6 [Frankliniella occidentalis]|uniref:Adenylate kinase isoenzyme 6 homolog n=1 Tax=Frankliniella occidentalis TaxID=133901 RepID=A0A6J1T9Z9_FRAOC|nr:adenylate kinase isoenzyme 6 [Frankliniella occidentalis]